MGALLLSIAVGVVTLLVLVGLFVLWASVAERLRRCAACGRRGLRYEGTQGIHYDRASAAESGMIEDRISWYKCTGCGALLKESAYGPRRGILEKPTDEQVSMWHGESALTGEDGIIAYTTQPTVRGERLAPDSADTPASSP